VRACVVCVWGAVRCGAVRVWMHWRLLTWSQQPSKRARAHQPGSLACHRALCPSPQASLLRVPLPDVTRRDVLLAIARMLPCAAAHRALVAAGTEAAVQALLAAGPASNVRAAAWTDVEAAASEVLENIRQPPPAAVRPAGAAEARQCGVCGKHAAAMPGGGPLKRCGGCRGPERWCSTECQRTSWLGGHREACAQRQAAAAAAAAAPAGN
jgi:hypothetical protein